MKFYFLLYWLILIAIIYVALLISPVRLKYLAFRWMVKMFVSKHHVGRNPVGSGRRKKVVDIATIAKEMGHESPLDDGDSRTRDYANSHLEGNWPGHRMGD